MRRRRLIMAEITQQLIKTGKYETFLNRAGEGNSEVILFLHGSGPGVFAWANWRYALDASAEGNMIVCSRLVWVWQ